MANDTTDLLLDNLRSKLPGAADDAILLELFNVADEVAREALREDAPEDPDAAPDTWLPAGQWVPNYQTLLYGVLARMYAQLGKPYADEKLAASHLVLYLQYLDLSRTESSGLPLTIQQRLLSTLRVQAPTARDVALKLEVYNTIGKIRAEALRLEALEGDEDFDDWLPDDATWVQCYQAIVHGTLARLFFQVGRPWSSPDLAKAQYKLYEDELDLVRGEASSDPDAPATRLMDLLRVRLVGARDEIIKMELFATLDELFRTTNLWQEEVDFSVDPENTNPTFYEIESEEATAKVIRLLQVVNSSDTPVKATMQIPEELTLASEPAAVDTYTATVALTLADPTDSEGFPRYPSWVLEKYLDNVMDGVLGRMMSQAAKPYSNERMSIYHLRRWRNVMAQVRVDVSHKNVHSAQAWQYPRGVVMAIYQGTYYTKTFLFKTSSDGSAIDITGWEFEAQLRDRVDTDALLTLTTNNGGWAVTDGPGGALEMRIAAELTVDLPIAKLVFDVLRTDASPGPTFQFRAKVPVRRSATVID